MKPQSGAAPRWVGLAGPTASGKSAVAMALAADLPLEIVSVDSALVYRGMDIGTAKPSAAERARVPHHLIDILDPSERYSAARFVADAQQLIKGIAARGRVPLLVGGTMLYFKALEGGLDTLPAADAPTRAALEADASERGWPALHAELQRVDPATAARLAPHDAQRIQRALEIFRLTGRPMSQLLGQQTGATSGAHLVSLEPASRAWLHQRIAARYEQMMEAGFWDEAMALRQRGDLHPGLPALRAVGYRQAWEMADARGDSAASLSAGEETVLRERVAAATRQLAKRQLTWLRSMPGRRAVDAQASDATDQVRAHVQAVLAT